MNNTRHNTMCWFFSFSRNQNAEAVCETPRAPHDSVSFSSSNMRYVFLHDFMSLTSLWSSYLFSLFLTGLFWTSNVLLTEACSLKCSFWLFCSESEHRTVWPCSEFAAMSLSWEDFEPCWTFLFVNNLSHSRMTDLYSPSKSLGQQQFLL